MLKLVYEQRYWIDLGFFERKVALLARRTMGTGALIMEAAGDTEPQGQFVRFFNDEADKDGLALCLSEAFSSGIWSETPMPVGHCSDPDSARGVISRLGNSPVTVAASGPQGLMGCVLGAVLTPELVRLYGLSPWGARPGDGLLAFIGIVPNAQGRRVGLDGEGQFLLDPHPENPSLARCLFERWLSAHLLADCPRLFIRTRRRIGAVRYLSKCFGFVECGAFEVNFRGQRQWRLVYRRAHAGFPLSEVDP